MSFGKAPRPTRGPDDEPRRAARCLTDSSARSWSSAASVSRPPGRGPARFPRPIPWRCSSATTPPTCTAPPSRGTTSRPAWPCSWPGNSSSVRRGSGSPGWASVSGSDRGSPRGRCHRRRTGRLVVGELHQPVRATESRAREWLTIPERGLYTGVAIFGAVGSGKTSACMHPFVRQLLSWHAKNPERRAAALVLEVKGIFATTSAGC